MDISTNKTEWGISLKEEREIWTKKFLKVLIPIPDKCNICKTGVIYIRNNNSINNPLLGKCNNYKCQRQIYLRIGTIFEKFNKTPASVLFNILKIWLFEENNVSKTINILENKYKIEKLNKNLVYKFVEYLRTIIANYIRSIYILEPLSNENSSQHIAVDESLFTHNGGTSQWVIGLINTQSNVIRLEIVNSRDAQTLKTILEKHVLKGNIIISDLWGGYNFLNNPYSGYK
jgi:hypothetical protein